PADLARPRSETRGKPRTAEPDQVSRRPPVRAEWRTARRRTAERSVPNRRREPMSTPNDEQPTRPLPPVDGGTDDPTRVMDASAGVVPPNEPPYGPPTDEFPEGGGGGNRKFLFVMLAVVAAIAIAGILVLVLGGGDDDETTTAASTATEETVETVEEE